MHRFSFFILFLWLSSGQFVAGQDTLRVQTFTWADESRSKFFDFPDAPGQSFRKIWMRYNMRCHNAAVGNANGTGCYEWDYSCNTFIYDPSRVDSTLETHPDLVVAGYGSGDFPYSETPTYTYYQYQQHHADLNWVNPVGAPVGAGVENFGWNSTERTGRTQILITAAELTAAGLQSGEMDALRLFPQGEFRTDFLRVGLKNTTLNALDPARPELDGWQEVYFENTNWSDALQDTLNFYQPFVWDGQSNILVDINYDNATGANDAVVFDGHFNSQQQVIKSISDDYALNYQGAGRIVVPENKFDLVSNEVTVMAWTYGSATALPANNTYLFEGYDAQGRRQLSAHVPWSNGSVYFDCGNNGSGYDRIDKAAQENEYKGRWNHWAFTKNAATGDMKIYLNGALWHSATGKTKTIDVDSFHIASGITGDIGYYGSIDEFQVWNKALDETTIRAWMNRRIDPTHPQYAHLQLYYTFNEGQGLSPVDAVTGAPAGQSVLPYYQLTTGNRIFKDFETAGIRPNVQLLQGGDMVSQTSSTVLDSIENIRHLVTWYGVVGSTLTVTGTDYLYNGGPRGVFDQNGQLIDTINIAPDGVLSPQPLQHYVKNTAKFELLSLVTPYGNGLNLGDNGKTFVFDVTDYAPILKGNKRLSIEMGGERQEELDIEFLFITGTPPREVKNIQQVWPFGRGWIDQVLSDRYFEPRSITAEADYFKLRAAITGHGQNGEFVARNHYLNVDGGAAEFNFDVWKECADNPIYPQGGTWIFDRAGWCPGAATDVHEFDITPLVASGQPFTLDYGVNGATMTEANYLVNAQLVGYGPYNFALDAAIERIARPNNEDVEFERINPACATPLVWVRNTGAAPLTTVQLNYSVIGGPGALTHTWTGNLAPDAMVAIELPVTDVHFFETAAADRIFEVSIAAINGQNDEYAPNNVARSHFSPTIELLPENEYQIYFRTNNNAGQNSFTLKNASGEIVLERSNMPANTATRDILDLAAGCYTFTVYDTGEDGLSFWFFPENGSGFARLIRRYNGTVDLPVRNVNPDFGKIAHIDFTVAETVGSDEPRATRVLSAWPNPADAWLQVDLTGFDGESLSLQLIDAQGRIARSVEKPAHSGNQWSHTFNTADLPKGLYFLQTAGERKVYTQKIAIQ